MIMFVSLAGEYKCFCVPDGRSAQCGLVGRVCMCVCMYICMSVFVSLTGDQLNAVL